MLLFALSVAAVSLPVVVRWLLWANAGRMDGRYDLGALGLKKKRGRPRKTDTVLLPGEISALGVTPMPDAKSKKPRLPNSDASQSGDPKRTLLGQPVRGVVDGSFDAGYLVTVRVGDSDTVFRGVVFGPGLSIPLSETIDVAPKVKAAKGDAGLPAYSPTSASPTPTMPSQADLDRGTAVLTTPHTFADTTPTMPLSSEKEISNFVQQQDFVQQVAQGFTAQGFSTSMQNFHLADSHFRTDPPLS